jgi:prolyl oligopeptidase
MGAASIGSVDDKTGQLFMWYEDYLTPSSLYLYTESTGTLDLIASLPARYDATPYMTEQLWATSKDGTKVPYFVIRKKDFKLDSEHPAWIYGYGGFEISLTPGYLQNVPDFWLKDDGIYVVANIRGGGEFGPEWHKAALLENRQRAFDDFQAVAEDLVKRQYTKPARIGIEGGSNGGLLTGVSVTQRPELFAAAIIDVPLLDMLRYDQLLAGASWVAEYGSPSDPKMHDVLAAYSPLHNLKEGVEYPEVFIKTSTADDRVHPGHARRFAYRMAQLGQDYLYFENIEGGHGGSANKKQSATIGAYEFVYMREKLMEQNTSKK